MTDTPEPADPDDETLAALLCLALDSADEHRIALVTRLALFQLDALREDDLDRLRRDGAPPVFRL